MWGGQDKGCWILGLMVGMSDGCCLGGSKSVALMKKRRSFKEVRLGAAAA